MYLVIALALFLLATRASMISAALWTIAAVVVAMGSLLVWLIAIDTSMSVAVGYVLGETARFAAPSAGAAALGAWWGAQVRRVTLAGEEAALAKEEHEARVEQAQRAERARIAQELHDVAGQHLAGLITLSDAALALAETQPDAALGLIEEVRTEGRFAAASLAGALSDLRATGTEPETTSADLLGAARLIDYWRRIGMAVDLSSIGDLTELPAVVSSTAFRALQEALTNAAKHAPGSPVDVRITVGAGQLSLQVRNGPVDAAAEPLPGIGLGWGLQGMRERVELLHGTLSTGTLAAGGWELRLTIPLAPPDTDWRPA